MTPVLEWRNVTITADKTEIVTDFNLTVGEGEKIVLYGASGTGKTSILKSALGFIAISGGELFYRGEPVGKKLIWQMRREIAYVPQNPDIGEGEVGELIDTVFALKANPDLPRREEIDGLFEIFELPADTKTKRFELLSGGEKQRIGIVISLLLKRDIFFLDEVTASLDGDMKKKVVRYFADRSGDLAQLIVSHDPQWRKAEGIQIIDIAAGGRS